MNQFHKDNLLKLADYLDKLPSDYANFSMSDYAIIEPEEEYEDPDFMDPNEVRVRKDGLGYECGAVCCAVGHGPAAGITPWYEDKTWVHYAQRVFGVPRGFTSDTTVFTYLFHSDWTSIDNTPQGAAARIRTYVKNDGHVPDGWTPPWHKPEIVAAVRGEVDE